MMINLIITQNIPEVFPVFSDSHLMGCLIQSGKHSNQDRLRALKCPADIINTIGGWHTSGVGRRYGTGQPLEVKVK